MYSIALSTVVLIPWIFVTAIFFPLTPLYRPGPLGKLYWYCLYDGWSDSNCCWYCPTGYSFFGYESSLLHIQIHIRSFSVERQICFSSWKDDIFLLKCIVRHHSNKIVSGWILVRLLIEILQFVFFYKKSTKNCLTSSAMTVILLGCMMFWTDVSTVYFNRSRQKRQIKKL